MNKFSLIVRKIYFWIVYMLKLVYPERIMQSATARKELEELYIKKTAVFSQKVNYAIEYDLMIIVPIYNSAECIEMCLQSLLHQKTNYTYKIICVDDGSTDQTESILQKYKKFSNVEIIRQKNAGVASARNKALENICGQYVLFVDSDDLLPEYSIELLMSTAIKNKADIVEGEYREFNENINVDMHIFETEEKQKKINGYPWGKVINAEKLRNLCFPDGFQYEDTIITMLLMPTCRTNIKLSDVTYYYRRNPNGITGTIQNKKQSLDTYYMTRYCLEEMIKRGHTCDLSVFLNHVRLNWMRIQSMPKNIQRAVFIEEAELLDKYFNKEECARENLRKMQKALQRRKYSAYVLLMNHWHIL